MLTLVSYIRSSRRKAPAHPPFRIALFFAAVVGIGSVLALPAFTAACTYTLTTTSAFFSSAGNTDTVSVSASLGSCTWSAVSNAAWITITDGSAGTGSGTVSYTVLPGDGIRRGTMTIAGQTVTVTQSDPSSDVTLTFPHIDTTPPWHTEIAIVNTGAEAVVGTLRALGSRGERIGTRGVALPGHGRMQLDVAEGFGNHRDIRYLLFETGSPAVQGYTKFSVDGTYRTAVPAVKEVNQGTIYIPHIDSGAEWWTGVTLLNTTASPILLTMTFNTGESRMILLEAREHRAFTIAELFHERPHPGIESAVITNAAGVIGLELLGKNSAADPLLEGLLLTDATFSTLTYPHVPGGDWWTGIVAYNPAEVPCRITIRFYSDTGGSLGTERKQIPAGGKYVGTAWADLPLPPGTAWIRIDSDRPLTGFELFGAGGRLAAYTGGGGAGTRLGVFPKIEKSGWTGIAFVNSDARNTNVTLIAYDDAGGMVATRTLTLGGYAKTVASAEDIFPESIEAATYIAYASDRNVVGFQLNGSADNTLLDGLPVLAGVPLMLNAETAAAPPASPLPLK